jgi:hypothetical protein
MAKDPFFDLPEMDVFGGEVEALVISVYKATIAGIEELDKLRQDRFKAYDREAHPEILQESWWWEDQVQAMRYHAGSMALVSLILLFQHWLEKRQKEEFSEAKIQWRNAFNQLEMKFSSGPLSLAELEGMVTARNSIIHHRGKPEYESRGIVHTVGERFLGFHADSGPERVAIEEPLLIDLATKLVSQVNFWNRQKRKQ